jgi:hypothetical protein
MTNTKIYLDIDGVLLKRDCTLANHAKEFLEWVVVHFDCYWLTTRDRCRHEKIITAFGEQIPESLIRKIHSTKWETLKTEAIDFDSNYYFIDDGLLATERSLVGDRWISVNVNKKPNDLIDVWNFLIELHPDYRFL